VTFDEYQKQALKTDLSYQDRAEVLSISFMDKVLGLVGESGEIADKIKKILRDKKGQLSNEDRAELAKELGDVQWYIATLAHYLGVPLEQIVQENVEKLKSRQVRGTLSGKGDNR